MAFKLSRMEKRLIIAASIVGGYYICKKGYEIYKERSTPIHHDIIVTKKEWVRTDNAYVYTKKTGSGYEVPDGAFDIRKEKKVRYIEKAQYGTVIDVPYPVYDSYYIYSYYDWVHTGQLTQSDSTPSDDAIKKTPDLAGCVSPSAAPYKEGDRKLGTPSISYYIYGTDANTGMMVKIEVDTLLYDTITPGNHIEFSNSGFKEPNQYGGIKTYYASDILDMVVDHTNETNET